MPPPLINILPNLQVSQLILYSYRHTMMVRSSLFVLVSLVLVLIEGYNEKILYNIDMPGGDLHGMPIHMDPGASPSECQQLCGNRHACKIWAYTLNKCRKPLCWLKYQPRRQNRNRCTVSIIVSADMHYNCYISYRPLASRFMYLESTLILIIA